MGSFGCDLILLAKLQAVQLRDELFRSSSKNQLTNSMKYHFGDHSVVGSDVPLLGKIPVSPALRTGGDDGAPIVDSDPASAAAKAITEVAEKLMKRSKSLLGVRLGVST
jgi:hypothetical protein